jgi:hypothetical protein
LVTDKNEKSRKPQKTPQEIVWQCRCIYRGLFNVKLTDGRRGRGRETHISSKPAQTWHKFRNKYPEVTPTSGNRPIPTTR